MKKKLPLITAILSATVLSACSGSGGGKSSGLNNNSAKDGNHIYFDQIAVVPLTSYNSAPNYLFHLNNPTNEDWILDSYSVSNTSGTVDLSKLVPVVTSGKNIPAGGTLDFNFTVHAKKSTDVLIKATLKNASGETKIVAHLLRLSTQISGNGIIGVNDIDKVVNSKGDFGIMVPVILTQDYDSIKASNGTLACNTPKYTKGAACSLLINGRVPLDNTHISSTLTGVKGEQTTVLNGATNIRVGEDANLLISHNPTIDASKNESETKVTLFNSGNIAAKEIKFADLGEGFNQTNDCAEILAADGICNITVKTSQTDEHKEATLTANYQGINATNLSVSTNVSYFANPANPGVSFTDDGSLLNVNVGESKEVVLTIKNNKRTLQNLQITSSGRSSSAITMQLENCSNGGKLAKDAKCKVKLKYLPTKEETNASFGIIFKATYTDQNGKTRNYWTTHSIEHSSVDNSNFLYFIPAEASLSAIADGKSKDQTTLTLKNSSDTSIASLLAAPALKDQIAGLSIGESTNLAANQSLCSISDLAANEECHIPLILSPADEAEAKEHTTDVIVKYKSTLGTTEKDITAQVKTDVVAKGVAHFETPEFKFQGAYAKESGNLILANPSKNNLLKLTYNFKNTGESEAQAFRISGIPASVDVDITSTCSTTASTVANTVAAEGSCDLILTVPRKDYITHSISNKRSGNFTIPLSYSFITNGKLVKNSISPTEVKQISYSRDWASISNSHIISHPDASFNKDWQIHDTFKASSIADASIFPITVSIADNRIPNQIGDIKSCQITQEKDSCDIKFKLSPDTFNKGLYHIDYHVKGNGLADEDALEITREYKLATQDPMKFETVSISDQFACGIAKEDKQLYCWGSNDQGQLGNGSNNLASIPTKVTNPSGVTSWKQVTTSGSEKYACGIAQDNKAYCWGSNGQSQLGNNDGKRLSQNTPGAVTSSLTWQQIQVSEASHLSCGIDSNSQAYCWGSGVGTGVTGNGKDNRNGTPQKVINPAGVNSWTQISPSRDNNCGLANTGDVYCWGNKNEVIGNETFNKPNTLKPEAPITKPEGVSSWLEISANTRYHACALGDNQQIYCWGAGNSPRANGIDNGASLGLDNKSNTSIPIPTLITSAYDGIKWKHVYASSNNTCAIDSKDQAYCWGDNRKSQLGRDASGINSATPVPLNTSDTPIKSWKQITMSQNNACGIAQDDVLYCVGEHSNSAMSIIDKIHQSGTSIVIPSPMLKEVNFN